MTHDLIWTLFSAAVAAGALLRYKHKQGLEQYAHAELIRRRREFFAAQKERWRVFYFKNKREHNCSDVELVTRFIFVTHGEITGMPRLDGFSFPTIAPTRDDILAAIADDRLISASRLSGLSAALDSDAVATFGYRPEVLANLVRDIHVEDD